MSTTMRTATRSAKAARAPRTGPRFYVLPRDGWLTLLLTILIIYITIASVQNVQPPWASGLEALTGAMALGIALGYLATQQNTLSNNLAHLLVTIIGVLASIQLTANVAVEGDRLRLLQNTYIWFKRALTPDGTSADNSVFLFFLTTLTFLLAYMTMWLVFHARRPWLAVVANAVVLLINLGQSTTDEFYFLIIFLVLTLLLLVRFTLAENVRHWRRTGLRFSPDLGWDFMQAGAIFAVIVALLPNLLPIVQPDPSLVGYWNSNHGPLSTIEQRIQNLFSGVNGHGYTGVAFFGSSLSLIGTVDLPQTQVLHYSVVNPVQDDPTQYLITEAYSTYDGIDTWTRGQTTDQAYTANQMQPVSTANYHLNAYRIVLDSASSGGVRFILAPGSSAASFSIPSVAQVSSATKEPITWLSQQPLSSGDSYIANGYVSTASVDQLDAVPYPAQAETASQNIYPQAILDLYMNSNTPITPFVAATAQTVTKGAPNMYQAAVALQNYLRTFTYNTHNPNPPSNEDATVWFLQRKEGFCTFFASAMALMGRSLGMPTRIVSGYTAGSYDDKAHAFIVRGAQAHTWTQIYFGQYGWVNFEPTSSFSPFLRPLASSGSSVGGANATPNPKPISTPKDGNQPTPNSTGTPHTNVQDTALFRVGVGVFIALLIALIVVGLLWLWWRSRFRAYSPTAASFARLILLGVWAGAPPRPSQTARDYARRLAAIAPEQRASIERVGALYSQERWGDPLTPSEMSEMPQLYQHGRTGLAAAITRRLRRLPSAVGAVAQRQRNRIGSRLRSWM